MCGSWEQNLDTLEEQQALLTDRSLQPKYVCLEYYFISIYHINWCTEANDKYLVSSCLGNIHMRRWQQKKHKHLNILRFPELCSQYLSANLSEIVKHSNITAIMFTYYLIFALFQCGELNPNCVSDF